MFLLTKHPSHTVHKKERFLCAHSFKIFQSMVTCLYCAGQYIVVGTDRKPITWWRHGRRGGGLHLHFQPSMVVPPLSKELKPHIRLHLFKALPPLLEPVLQMEPVEVEGAIPVLKHSTPMQTQRHCGEGAWSIDN